VQFNTCGYTSLARDSIYATARYMPSPVRLSVTRVDQSKTCYAQASVFLSVFVPVFISVMVTAQGFNVLSAHRPVILISKIRTGVLSGKQVIATGNQTHNNQYYVMLKG